MFQIETSSDEEEWKDSLTVFRNRLRPSAIVFDFTDADSAVTAQTLEDVVHAIETETNGRGGPCADHPTRGSMPTVTARILSNATTGEVCMVNSILGKWNVRIQIVIVGMATG